MRWRLPEGEGGSPSSRRKLWVTAFLLLWTLGGVSPAAAQITTGELAERRAALAAQVGDGVILALGAPAPAYDYLPWSQGSAFRYLTGFLEWDAALLMEVRGGVVRSETLFVNPRDPERETWEGLRVGPERVEERFGLPGRAGADLGEALEALLEGENTLHVVAPFQPGTAIPNPETLRLRALLERTPGVEVRPIVSLVARLRAVKSDAELALIRRSVEITTTAHQEVLRVLRPGLAEFEIQGLVEYTFRRYGAERPAFSTIAGSGPHSTILHYNANDRFMEDGDVLVLDIGASYAGYAADITRTLPVNGRFSPPQREIYEVVREAQRAGEEAVRIGGPYAAVGAAAREVIADGLARLGLIEGPDATYDCGAPGRLRECPQLQLYYMHGVGHGIGLDVHDPLPPLLEPGSAFSIEPGIYVRPNLFTEVIPDTPRNRALQEAVDPAFRRYMNIGVRIEDNYILTEDGLRWLSRAPREIEEIEAALAAPREGPPRRDGDRVEDYRRLTPILPR